MSYNKKFKYIILICVLIAVVIYYFLRETYSPDYQLEYFNCKNILPDTTIAEEYYPQNSDFQINSRGIIYFLNPEKSG